MPDETATARVHFIQLWLDDDPRVSYPFPWDRNYAAVPCLCGARTLCYRTIPTYCSRCGRQHQLVAGPAAPDVTALARALVESYGGHRHADRTDHLEVCVSARAWNALAEALEAYGCRCRALEFEEPLRD